VSIDFEPLVDPAAYDELIYEVLHSVVDRTVELAAKADTAHTKDEFEDALEEDEGFQGFVNIIRSQANFTPSERAEFQATGILLNLLINAAVARRSSLYHDTHPEET
jgi:hypothetical protein